MEKLFLIIFLGLLILSPLLSSAAGIVPCGRTDPSATTEERQPCQFCHLFVLFKNIADFLLIPSPVNNYVPLIPVIAALMLAVGGFMYIFAYFGGGEIGGKAGPALLSQANKLLTSVVWGLLIIFGAWIFINTFFQLIGVATWDGWSLKEGWWKIECSVR